MKIRLMTAAAAVAAGFLGGSSTARAALDYNWTGTQVIPDDDLTGVAFPFSILGGAPEITDVTVTLDITGGWNGDLYAYLAHDSGFAVLLNRVGVGQTAPGSDSLGYGDTGFSGLVLSSAASANVHFYGNASPTLNGSGQLTGSWRPDGRGIAPNSAPSAFDAAGTADFSTFNGLNPNGSWTLFIADAAPGSLSTLTGFTVSITAVPETVPLPLAAFGASIAAVVLWRRSRTGRS